MPANSVRLLIPTPLAGEANDIPAHLLAMAAALEARAGGHLAGTFAARPAAAASNARFLYYATDALARFVSDGAAWIPLGETVSMTTAQRDALVAGGKWDGRLIYNSTTLALELYSAASASWVPAGGGDPLTVQVFS